MPAQLKIQDIRALKIDFALVQPGALSEPEGADAQPQHSEGQRVDFTLNFKTEHLATEPEPMIKVVLGVHVKGEKLPFYIKADIGGIFMVEGSTTEEELDRIMHINCNGILFPYLRELISDICKRGGLPQIFLPPVNFVDLHRKGVFKKSDPQDTAQE